VQTRARRRVSTEEKETVRLWGQELQGERATRESGLAAWVDRELEPDAQAKSQVVRSVSLEPRREARDSGVLSHPKPDLEPGMVRCGADRGSVQT